MPAVAFVDPVPNNFGSGPSSQFDVTYEFKLFDSGGVGIKNDEATATVLASDTGAQIATKIAAAVRAKASSAYGVTIPANAVAVPSITRA